MRMKSQTFVACYLIPVFFGLLIDALPHDYHGMGLVDEHDPQLSADENYTQENLRSISLPSLYNLVSKLPGYVQDIYNSRIPTTEVFIQDFPSGFPHEDRLTDFNEVMNNDDSPPNKPGKFQKLVSRNGMQNKFGCSQMRSRTGRIIRCRYVIVNRQNNPLREFLSRIRLFG